MITLKVHNAVRKFNNKTAVNQVSFSVNRGEIVGYLGPNGSGKTTTIRSILGLLQLNSGSIEVLGQDISEGYENLYGKVSALFDSNGLYERLTGRENLVFYLKACGRMNNLEATLNLAEEMEISGDLDNKVMTYSKGMKRKLALIRCLSIQPELLLLDEPFDGIDIESRAKIIKLIKDQNQMNNTSIVITSHVMADIEDLTTRLIILRKGVIELDESMTTFKKLPGITLTDRYLEVIQNES